MRYLSLRFKLLIGFTLVFTLIFAGAYYWFYSFATNEALARITEDLVNTMQAAVNGIDGDQLQLLDEQGVPREDGYTDDPRYWEQVGWLGTVHNIEPRAALYTFRAGDAPNELVFITSSGAVAEPPFGAVFRESWVPDSANEVVSNMAGLEATTLQTTGRAPCTYGTEGCKLEPYGDQWGQWVSAFTPVKNSQGEVVAALGIDFEATYVREVQNSILEQTLWAFGITYAILFLLVYSLSSFITRPITALTAVAGRIGEGDYESSQEELAKTSSSKLFADETTKLSQVFEIMVGKVYQREQKLRQQVEELRIEIDEARRLKDVGEIVETDFFRELQTKARDMRARAISSLTNSKTQPKAASRTSRGWHSVLPHIAPDIPVAVVSNFVEAHYDFLSRAASAANGQNPLDQEAYHADRTLLWVGDPKLVFVSHAIPHAAYLCDLLGYAGTRQAAPQSPTPFLSRDILREPHLLDELLRHAGPHARIQLVPYATTPDFLNLVDALRREHGLHVLLPESPAPQAMWLRDYVDTKSGFHHLAGRWLPNAGDILPEAYPCETVEQAATVVRWFHAAGRACIAKPDTGESGLGVEVMLPAASGAALDQTPLLQHNPYWADEPILVEEYIAGPARHSTPLSPSMELFVPHMGAGEPAVTYVSEQLFQDFGEFSGVLVSRDQREACWYAPCVENSLRIAHELQARGYAGHFDVDAVVDGRGRPYLLELNARRTGGTHVHDFGRFYFGPDYVDTTALLSWESVDCGAITDWQTLLATLDGLLFPIAGAPRGVIVTITSALRRNQCGVVIAGVDRHDVLQLQEALSERLAERAGEQGSKPTTYDSNERADRAGLATKMETI